LTTITFDSFVLNFDVSEEWAKQRGEDKEYNSDMFCL